MEHSAVKTVRTGRFEMDYFCFGSGERPFVMIPGVSVQSVMPAADAITDGYAAFGERYTLYVFDRKRNMQAGYSVYDMAEDTAEAMKLLGIEGADIFGASQGGMMALCIAVEHPELAHALYIASSCSRQNEMSRAVTLAWLDAAKTGDIRTLNHEINTHVYGEDYYSTYREIFDMIEAQGSAEDIQRLCVQVEAARSFDIYDRLDEIRCPVFVGASKDDRVLGYGASVEIAEKLGCPLHTYEKYGHAVYDECPDFRPRMLDALKSLD